MKEALTYIIKSIVDNPDQEEINEEELDGGQNLTVKVAKDDMGKIIGKEGKVIRAIRNVMKIPAIKQNIRIVVTLEENSAT